MTWLESRDRVNNLSNYEMVKFANNDALTETDKQTNRQTHCILLIVIIIIVGRNFM